MNFGQKVRASRKALDLDQSTLAERVGVSRRMISLYENNHSRPHGYEAARRLADALEVDVDWLLDENEDKEVNAPERLEEVGRELTALFAGGKIAEEDLDMFMLMMQDAYWIAKRNAKMAARKED